MAELFRLLANGVRVSQDALADCMASIIIAAYLLGKRLGIPFTAIDSKIESKIRLGMIEAVSYTHLDVYKRQIFSW